MVVRILDTATTDIIEPLTLNAQVLERLKGLRSEEEKGGDEETKCEAETWRVQS